MAEFTQIENEKYNVWPRTRDFIFQQETLECSKFNILNAFLQDFCENSIIVRIKNAY